MTPEQKKLLYKSLYRGNKENDYILGSFAKKLLPEMTNEDLAVYGDFLEETDTDIQDWLTEKEPFPQKYPLSFVTRLLAHYAYLKT